MELVELSRDVGQGTNSRVSPSLLAVVAGSGGGGGDCKKGGRYLSAVRKYLPLVCLLETLAITLLIAYLFIWTPSTMNRHKPATGADSSLVGSSTNQSISSLQSANVYQTFSNGHKSARLRVGLVQGCNQRIHDLSFSVKCKSQDAFCRLTGEETKQQTHNHQREPSAEPGRPIATLITTSKSGLRMKSEQVPLKRIQCSPSSEDDPCSFKTQLIVDVTATEQEIIGWGGALSDSSINNILSLTTNGTKRLLDDYFGDDGLKFNMVRITIGGSDFSSRFYTNDDMDHDDETVDDLELKNFRLREEDTLYKIPIIKHIQDEYKGRDLKVFASMWSPPVWMKTNRHFNRGYLKGSSGDSRGPPDERYFGSLAQLKKNFLLAYQERSIKFWGLTVMNEPLFAIQPFLDFNTMIFPKEDYGNYVANYLGPTIRQDPRLKHIKLIAHDDNRKYLIDYTEPILRMKNVRRYIDGVSVHGYVDEDYHLMDEIRLRHNNNDSAAADFFVLPTELCSAHLPFMEKPLMGNWHRGVHYALDIIRSLQHSAAGWVHWNMVLDTTGGPGWLGGRLDSPVIVDKNEDSFHKSPMFYALGHFSRYVPSKSYKLKTRITNDKYDYHFETVTFLLAGKEDLATVVLNNNPYAVDLNIKLHAEDQEAASFAYQVTCAPESISTIIYSKRWYFE